MLHASASRTNLTPPVGIAHAGWGVQTHSRAAGVDLDLLGTVLVVESDDTAAAIVDVEYCIVEEALATQIRRAVASLADIPFECVMLTYTHTHSGPMLGPSWLHDGSEMVEAYVASIPDRLAGCAWQARRSLRPARLVTSDGTCDIGVNRRLRLPSGRIVCGRNWEGFVDRQVRVVRIDDLEERPIATLLNFQCHPTVMGPPNQLVTPDYPGVARRVVESAVGGLCLFTQGAAGNIHAVVDYVGDPAVYHRLGSVLGHEAAKLALRRRTVSTRERLVEVWESSAPLGVYVDEELEPEDARVRVAWKELDLPLRAYPAIPDLRARYEALLLELESFRMTGDGAAIAEATGTAKRAHMLLEYAQKYEGQKEVHVALQGLRIGDLAIVGFPGEPFAEIGVAVKTQSVMPATIFAGYANGYLGYLPTDDAFPLGGYEVDLATPFLPGAADAIVQESLALLADLAGGPSLSQSEELTS